MHITNISVTRLASSTLDVEGALHWIRNVLGFSDYEMPAIGDNGVTPAAVIAMMAAKRCYNAFDVGSGNLNLTKVRTDMAEYLDNVMKSGHGSVFEHVTFTYAIEGITRVCSAELNRHRAGVAVSEASMRYIRTDDLGWRVPNILLEDNTVLNEALPHLGDISERKQASIEIMETAFSNMEESLSLLADIWGINSPDTSFHAKKQLTSAFRRIVGMGVSTGGVWTFNVRALRHILSLRGDIRHAEEEIYEVADLIATDMARSEPLLFGDFTKTTDGIWRPLYHKI